MEVIAFHFVPPEIMRRDREGRLESLSDLTTRRVVHGLLGDTTFPQHQNFLDEGIFPLEMQERDSTHQPRIIIEKEKAWLEMKKRRHLFWERSHFLIDRQGNPLPLRRKTFPLDMPPIGAINGMGIVRRYADSFAVEWYVCVIGNL